MYMQKIENMFDQFYSKISTILFLKMFLYLSLNFKSQEEKRYHLQTSWNQT